MTTPPLVTIGIPTFNRVTSLAVTISSALAQTYPNIEVVVSDNCSTDGTRELCLSLVEAEPRLSYILQDQNHGAWANFQSLLDTAKGDFFMWLADDDWIDLNYVDICVNELLANHNIQLVSGEAIYSRNGVELYAGETYTIIDSHPLQRVLAYYRRATDNGIFYGVARTGVRRKFGRLRSRHGEDWLMVAALAHEGRVVTTERTRIYRAVGPTFSLPTAAWGCKDPDVRLSVRIFSDLLTSPLYTTHSFGRRFTLAVRCAYAVGRGGIPRYSVGVAKRFALALLPSGAHPTFRAVVRRLRRQ